MGIVEDFAGVCTNPGYIQSLSEAAGRDVAIFAVLGNVTYQAIREDPYAKRAYEKMINEGAQIFFNPGIAGKEEVDIVDGKNIRILNRLSGLETRVMNSLFRAKRHEIEIKKLAEDSLLLKNFDEPAEKLAGYFEKHSSGYTIHT